jgi:hypothetical protein
MPSPSARHARWRLPAPAACLVFGALPVAERLRCREVCAAWRAAIDDAPSIWAHLDLRPYAALPLEAQGRLLRLAAARAAGALRSLALALPAAPTTPMDADVNAIAAAMLQDFQVDDDAPVVAAFERFMEELLLPLLRAHRCGSCSGRSYDQLARADSRSRLARSATLLQLLCVRQDGKPAVLAPVHVSALATAAPRLRSLHVRLARVDLDAPDVRVLLRREGVFAPVRLSGAVLDLPEQDPHDRAATDALAAHDGLEELVLWSAGRGRPAARALERALDAAAAARVRCLTLLANAPLCGLALGRLLRAGALNVLSIVRGSLPEDAGGCAALAAGLRESALTQLNLLEGSDVFAEPMRGVALLSALTWHPTLADLAIELSIAPEAARAPLGAALGALVAANAPALTALDVNGAQLGDEGMRPLAEALRLNTHLQSLEVDGNALTRTFRSELAAAARACTSLRTLKPPGADEDVLPQALE